MKRKRSFSW